MCVRKLCVCVTKLCVSKLCVCKLCVSKLYVCASCVCVCKLCVCCVCEAAGGGTDGGGRDAESKTRTPHKDVGKNQKPSLSKAGPFTLESHICVKALKCKVVQIIRCFIKPLLKKQHPDNFSRGYLMSGSVTQ